MSAAPSEPPTATQRLENLRCRVDDVEVEVEVDVDVVGVGDVVSVVGEARRRRGDAGGSVVTMVVVVVDGGTLDWTRV